MFPASTPSASAQQTLGGIRGTVTDQTGAVVPDTVVTVVGDETRLDAIQEIERGGRLRNPEPAHRHLHPYFHS